MRGFVHVFVFAIALSSIYPATVQGVSLKVPRLTSGSGGGTVTVSVLLSSVETVPAAQFTLDYDNSVATYQNAVLGSAVNTGAFSILVNPNPPVGTASPGTNASVIIQVFGGGPAGRVSGNDLELARVTFALAAGVCDTSPLTFDPNCNPFTQVVAGTSTVCFPQLSLQSGQVGTSCATDVAPSAGRGIQLLQNQPNPFNPSTGIRFSTADQGHVQLAVLDVLGRRVRMLVNENLPGGWHEASWNGCNDSGSEVASGVYYYRLMSGEEIQTRRMLLLK